MRIGNNEFRGKPFLTPKDLQVFHLSVNPAWIFSCANNKLLWANRASCAYFEKTLEALVSYQQQLSPSDKASLGLLTQLIRDEVEVGGVEQVLSSFGRSALPGVPSLKLAEETQFLYSPLKIASPSSEVTSCTLVQLLCPHCKHASLQGKPATMTVQVESKEHCLVTSSGVDITQSLLTSGGSPDSLGVAEILEMVEAILAGQPVELETVQILQHLLLKGEIIVQSSHLSEDLVREELEQDVGANLLQLLGRETYEHCSMPQVGLLPVQEDSLGKTGASFRDRSAQHHTLQPHLQHQHHQQLGHRLKPLHQPQASSSLRRAGKSVGSSLNDMLQRQLEEEAKEDEEMSPKHTWSGGSHTEGGDLVDKSEGGGMREDALHGDGGLMMVPSSLVPAMEAVLASVDEWRFDSFRLAEVTQGHPMSTLGFWLMQRAGLVNDGTHGGNGILDGTQLARFLRRIEAAYPDNPYHNRTHAADVLQTMHVLLTRGGLARRLGEDMGLLAGYLAAVIHDNEHRGLNNDFLVRTADELAVRYNDSSPMENHHAAAAFRILRLPKYNFLTSLPPEKQGRLRRLVIDMTLATDMKSHFAIMSKFQSKLQVKLRSNRRADSPTQSGQMMAVSSGGGGGGGGGGGSFTSNTFPASAGTRCSTGSGGMLHLEDEADRSLMLQMALKCADVGHLAAHWDVHHRWVSALEEEFYLQGDKEKMAGLAVSPLMDRTRDGITKSQVGFFDLVALPLFYSYAAVMHEAVPLARAVEDNCNRWRMLEVSRSSHQRR